MSYNKHNYKELTDEEKELEAIKFVDFLTFAGFTEEDFVDVSKVKSEKKNYKDDCIGTIEVTKKPFFGR